MLTWKRMEGLPELQTQCVGRREFSGAREGRDALVIYTQKIK